MEQQVEAVAEHNRVLFASRKEAEIQVVPVFLYIVCPILLFCLMKSVSPWRFMMMNNSSMTEQHKPPLTSPIQTKSNQKLMVEGRATVEQWCNEAESGRSRGRSKAEPRWLAVEDDEDELGCVEVQFSGIGSGGVFFSRCNDARWRYVGSSDDVFSLPKFKVCYPSLLAALLWQKKENRKHEFLNAMVMMSQQ